MSGAREEILRRIRGALDDVPAGEAPADVPVARDYRHARELGGPGLVMMNSPHLFWKQHICFSKEY